MREGCGGGELHIRVKPLQYSGVLLRLSNTFVLTGGRVFWQHHGEGDLYSYVCIPYIPTLSIYLDLTSKIHIIS